MRAAEETSLLGSGSALEPALGQGTSSSALVGVALLSKDGLEDLESLFQP